MYQVVVELVHDNGGAYSHTETFPTFADADQWIATDLAAWLNDEGIGERNPMVRWEARLIRVTESVNVAETLRTVIGWDALDVYRSEMAR